MEVKIHPSWQAVLAKEFDKEYFARLVDFVKKRYKETVVYPSPKNIFAAFNLCSFENIKVVILGQDPYHGSNQAHGLSFSVEEGQPKPPSLQNIYKELDADLGIKAPPHGNLTHWAEQGVLLLNATLTVESGKAGSHQNLGWEIFTDEVIRVISERKENVVFILWGSYAGKKSELIDESKHFIIKSAHPSPLSSHRGFFGSKPFSKTNEYLLSKGKDPVKW